MKRNQKASYWRYEGNHINGNDCRRDNPYGYPLALVSFLAGHKAESTIEDLNDVKVSRKRGSVFGTEITVSAPKDIWEEYWVKLADEWGEIFLADWRIDAIEADEDGLHWTKKKGDIVIEAHLRSENETPLQMVKQGYARLFFEGKEYWIESPSIAEG